MNLILLVINIYIEKLTFNNNITTHAFNNNSDTKTLYIYIHIMYYTTFK